MPTNFRKTESNIINTYQMALTNAIEVPQIKTALEEIGIDETEIAKGQALWQIAKAAYDFNKKEDNETTAASREFTALKQELEDKHASHRRKAKALFKKEPNTLDDPVYKVQCQEPYSRG
ncbi:hypothetical protein [Sediminitomix flava]|uniref:Uncharacterized protein n=1 Tax=Sediminitomix flava TaxID=379075 RepID=A0A315Z7Z9_SEDFL|nr:hypothetical protein [Sediminitomix flava]PWJ40045.1 hypothetical protein BC781_105108 [Sediminitomix flava]